MVSYGAQRPPLTIHVGYPKAASSFLQGTLFNKHSEITNIGRYAKRPGIVDYFWKTDSAAYSQRHADHLAEKYIYSNLHVGKTSILSEERFLLNRVEWKEVALRLRRIFPGARVLIVLRSQYDLIRSQYDMHPFSEEDHQSKWIPFSLWLHAEIENLRTSLLGALFYYDVIKHYEELFGRENLTVILFEELECASSAFARKLAEALEIDEEEASTILLSGEHVRPDAFNLLYAVQKRYLPAVKPSKMVSKRTIMNIKRWVQRIPVKYQTVLSSEDRAAIQDVFGANNSKLAQAHCISGNIEDMGYPLL